MHDNVFVDEPVSAMFISPSVTPWRVPKSDGSKTPPHNPAIRKYVIDASTFEVTDYEQYSLDLIKVYSQLFTFLLIFLEVFTIVYFFSIFQGEQRNANGVHSSLLILPTVRSSNQSSVDAQSSRANERVRK